MAENLERLDSSEDENNDREDLSEEDKLDLEEIKSDLGSDAERSSLDSTGHFDSNPNSRPCSAPSTPFNVNPKHKISSFDRDISAALSNIKSVNMSHMNQIKPLRGSVNSYKKLDKS